jgi:hypothetical protein
MTKDKSVETCLVLSTGFLLLFFLLHLKVFLFVAFGIGIIGIFIKPLAVPLAWLWIKLGEVMGFISSKVILSVVFFVFLMPISAMYRIAKKDVFGLKNTRDSFWINRNRKYDPSDLKNSW